MLVPMGCGIPSTGLSTVKVIGRGIFKYFLSWC